MNPPLQSQREYPTHMTMTNAPKITTVERHILDRNGGNPHATAEFSWLLSGITLAIKIIASHM